MTDPLSPDDADGSPGARESFVGTVKFSRINCDCEICESGRKGAEEAGVEIDDEGRVDHLMAIEVIDDTHENDQNVLGIKVNNTPGTKWMTMIDHLSAIHGDLKEEHGVTSIEELTDFLEGNTYKFKDITWKEDEQIPFRDFSYAEAVEDYTNTPKAMWVPVEEEDPGEYGGSGGAEDVEEIELE